jgi:flagellar motor switch protein FliG
MNTVAILDHLTPDMAAQVLGLLPDEKAADTIRRLEPN